MINLIMTENGIILDVYDVKNRVFFFRELTGKEIQWLDKLGRDWFLNRIRTRINTKWRQKNATSP